MRRTSITVLALILLVSVSWAGSSPVFNLGPEQNNLVIGTTQEPSNLNPWEGSADTKENILALMNIGLTYFDSDGVLRPGLATEIPTGDSVRINEDADGNFVNQEVDWSIRSDATWSDGTDISCADVLFTHSVQQRDDLPLSTTAFSGLVDSVACTNGEDGNDFTITFSAPNLFFANIGGSVGLARFYDIAPKHIWEGSVGDADSFVGAPSATGTDASQVVGSGPFSLVEWNVGQFMTLAPRADFVVAAPNLDEITVRFITNQATLLSAIFSGEIDASDDIGLAGQDPAVLEAQLGSTGVVEVTASGAIEKLNFNLFEDPEGLGGQFPDQVDCPIAADLLLHDPRTRQAIIQSIDRVTLAPTVFPGAIPSNSFIVAGDAGFNPALNAWPYNLEAAKELLADLGWERKDGVGILARTKLDGTEVEFRLPWVSTTADFRIQTGQLLQEALGDVGIALEVQNLPGSVVFSQEFISHGSDCVWGGIIEYAEGGGLAQAPSDPLSNELFANDLLENPVDPEPENAPLALNGFAGSNITGWTNPQFEQLRADALSEFDPAKRSQIVETMQIIYNNLLPTVPLYDRTEVITKKIGLVNFVKGGPAARTQFWNAWEWGWAQNGAQEVR